MQQEMIEKYRDLCPGDWKRHIDENNLEVFSRLDFSSHNFFTLVDTVLYIVRRPAGILPFLKALLGTLDNRERIVSFKEYFVFREAFRYQAGLEIIEFLWKNYFIPLTCVYQSPLLNACIQGNRSLICFLLENSTSMDWGVKNFKALCILANHGHFDLLFELLERGEIRNNDLLANGNYILKQICSNGDCHNMKRLAEIYGLHFELAIVSENAKCIERTIKSGKVETASWLLQKLEMFYVKKLFQQDNFYYVKIAAQTNNPEMFDLVSDFAGPMSVFFLMNLCKNLVSQGHLVMFKHLITKHVLSFKFESYMVEFYRNRLDEQNLIHILEYLGENQNISQESFTELFYSALACNKLELAKHSLSKLSEYNRQYLMDETILQHMHSKLTLSVRNWIVEQFPETREYLQENMHFAFTHSLVRNQLAEAQDIYRPGFVDRFNISFYIETACINSNFEMFEWLLSIEQPSSFLYYESFGKVCETGNMDLLRSVTQYTLLTEIQHGFVTACIHGHTQVLDYLYLRYRSTLDLEAAFEDMIAKQLQIENVDVFYWFADHHDLQKQMERMSLVPRKILRLLEGVCSGNSFELFRFVTRYITLNKSILTNVIKWAARNNRENILLYVMDIYRLYDVDSQYILKMCLSHGNYFVLSSLLYERTRFSNSLIKSLVKDVMSDYQAFQILFRDYIKHEPLEFEVGNLFEDCIDNGHYASGMLIFESLGPFEKYKAIKEAVSHSFLAYGNDAFFTLFLREYPCFANTVQYSEENSAFIFKNNIAQLIEEEKYKQVYELLGMNVRQDFPEQEPCYICLDKTATIKSDCGHLYCIGCLVEYVITYECTTCVMCRQPLNLRKLKNKKAGE